MSDEDWGPWQPHDGTRCPLRRGAMVQVKMRDGVIAMGVMTDPARATGWDWDDKPCPTFKSWVSEFRTRRFRAEQTLREIAENIREPEAV